MVERIVVGTDGSETAGAAVEEAVELARRFGAKLTVVSAYRPLTKIKQQEVAGEHLPGDVRHQVGPREEVNLVLTGALEKAAEAGVDAEQVPVEGDAVEAILDTAERVGADLIVVGNKGMTGARRVLGSVPNNISHHASCSVYIVSTTG